MRILLQIWAGINAEVDFWAKLRSWDIHRLFQKKIVPLGYTSKNLKPENKYLWIYSLISLFFLDQDETIYFRDFRITLDAVCLADVRLDRKFL